MKRKRSSRSGIDVLDEAFHLLRRAPAQLFVYYYAGTLPFLLAGLFLVSDASANASGAARAPGLSLMVAALFIVMNLGQSLFASRLADVIAGEPPAPVRARALLRRAYFAAALQPTKLFLIPLALLATLPFGWTFAFYEAALALPDRDLTSVSAVLRTASKRARAPDRPNWVILSVFGLFFAAVFLNVVILLLVVPQLIRTLVGVETVFAVAGAANVSGTFILAALALAYALADPLLKAAYTLRAFYAESVESGTDLKVQWTSVRRAMASLLVCACLAAAVARAETPAPVTEAGLQHSIDRVLARSEFQWKLAQPPRPRPGIVAWFFDKIGAFSDWLADRITDLQDWFRKHHAETPQPGSKSKANTLRVESFLWLLCGIMVVIAGILIWRAVRKPRRSPAEPVALAPPVAIAPTDPNLTADQLPEDEWMARARQAAEAGDLRVAVRMLYLGSLAALGRRGLIAIRRGKSNYDYFRELRRRARLENALLTAFEANLAVFEACWYGLGEVNAASYASFESNFERIRHE
jgi:hypothetical protein